MILKNGNKKRRRSNSLHRAFLFSFFKIRAKRLFSQQKGISQQSHQADLIGNSMCKQEFKLEITTNLSEADMQKREITLSKLGEPGVAALEVMRKLAAIVNNNKDATNTLSLIVHEVNGTYVCDISLQSKNPNTLDSDSENSRDISISDFLKDTKMSVGAETAFINAKASTLGELVDKYTSAEIRAMGHCDKNTSEEIKRILQSRGLSLKD